MVAKLNCNCAAQIECKAYMYKYIDRNRKQVPIIQCFPCTFPLLDKLAILWRPRLLQQLSLSFFKMFHKLQRRRKQMESFGRVFFNESFFECIHEISITISRKPKLNSVSEVFIHDIFILLGKILFQIILTFPHFQ